METKKTFIADFHIHSRYSRATSADCVPESLDWWARRKGLSVVGTGDFTHAVWRQELREKLEPAEDGLYRLKQSFVRSGQSGERYGEQGRECFSDAPRFMITGEISSIYKKNGRVRKVHNLILLPGLDEADALAQRLEMIGNLHSDGRPILGLDCHDLLEITLETCPRALLVPAHVWTPHFSVFGAYSGFDDITECFSDLTEHIVALETGLSSDPPMNWRLSALDRFALISNSDAHSPAKLAREANLFATEMGYDHIIQALKRPQDKGFLGTIEFFPEEGKYHFDGHRACNVCMSPAQTIAAGGRCPVCGSALTVGVLHRVEELADRPSGSELPTGRPFESLVPLPEVIAASTGLSGASKKGIALYEQLLHELGPELAILRTVPLSLIERAGNAAGRTASGATGDAVGGALAEGIRRLREGAIELDPGYDGAYGVVRILDADEIEKFSGQMQLSLEVAKQETGKKQGAVFDEAGISGSRALEVCLEVPAVTESPATVDAATVDAVAGDAATGLNDEQKAAVLSSAQAIAVQAGPGTGKTKTLVARIIHLIEDCGVAPATIAAVTFTNKAAREMRARLERHFGSRRIAGRRIADAVQIGTFHAISLRLLRQAGQITTVINEASAQLIIEELLWGFGVKLSSRDALREVSLRKSIFAEGDRWDDSGLPTELFEAYNERLKDYGVMDFDDILLCAEALSKAQVQEAVTAQGSTGVGEAGFSHLLVDEFQDTNPVQYRLIREWSATSASLFVIGDPNQSIYGFRGADARCFAWLKQDYPDLHVVNLTKNYRSTRAIIEAAVPLIIEDASKLNAQRHEGSAVRLVHTQTPFSEALFITKEINRLVGGIDMLDSDAHRAARSLRSFADIAILYRTNRQAALLEECLGQEGISYVVTGRDETLTHPDLAKTLAFFQLLLNPSDQVALMTCLNQLLGCPPADVAAVLKRYQAQPKTLSSLSSVLERCAKASSADALETLVRLIQHYGITVRKARPQKLLASWFAETSTNSGAAEWADRLMHMAVFHHTIEELLQTIILGQEGDVQRYGGKRYTRDAVSLMTLHAAKGLEFPVVFLCGVTEGLIPLRVSGARGKRNQEQVADNQVANNHVAEERRLLFVGMTRAKDDLILINHGDPSSFLSHIPPELLNTQHAGTPHKAPAPQQFSIW